jgi:hypothetical protein
MGPNPERWQWVAMFEITAALMALGVISAVSLFTQYGKVRLPSALAGPMLH